MTDWLPAASMLLVGILAGAIVAWSLWRRKRSTVMRDDLDFADLAARRDALIEHLRETPDAQDRAELELETARVLREIDRRVATASPPVAASPRPRVPASSLGGFLWGAGTVAVLAGLVFFVTKSATNRGEGAPVTGSAATNAGQPDADLGRLQQAVQQNPDDLEARLDLARAYLVREQLMEVSEHSQYVLERDPQNPRALSYQALVRLAMGQSDVALQMLQRALARDPESIEARIHLALVYATIGKTEEAIAAIEETIRRHPEERERLSGLLAQIRSSSAPAQQSVQLQIELGAGVKTLPGATLFVVARPAGVSEGAPIAVKRLNAPSFPMAVVLGPEDSMMGGKLTDRLRIDARLDSDGDPLTRPPTDPKASLDDVALGAANVRLVLQ